MKQIWIAILIMIAGASLHAQTGSIVRGAGIVYTDGPPNFDAHPKGAWIAIDTTSGYYWLWDKQAEDWVDGGGLIQSTGATGAPSYTPDLQHSRYAVNAGDSIFHYRAGSWRLASGALPDLSAYLQWGDTTTTIATKSDLAGVDLSAYPQRTELADTAAAIRGDFPVNTDAQTLSFSSPSLSISNGNSVNLSALVSGYVTGSGTTNELPYWATSSSLGSLTTTTYPNLTELSYVKGVTSALQTQLNAKHGGSLTSGYIPYSSAGGYGLANSGLYWDGTRLMLNSTIGTSAFYLLGQNTMNTLVVQPHPSVSSAYKTFVVNSTIGTEQFSIGRNGNINISNPPVTIGSTKLTSTGYEVYSGATLVGNVGQSTHFGGGGAIGILGASGRPVRIGGTGIGANMDGPVTIKGPGSTSATFNGRGENSSNVATWTSRDDGLFTAQKLSITSTTGPTWTSGTGSPEGVVTAPVGSIYSRTDGGAGTSLYVKESGAGNTGWVGK